MSARGSASKASAATGSRERPGRRPVCAVFIATSTDGYIARRDGGIDWLDRVQAPGEDYGFASFFASVQALVLGRRTYETALGFPEWPYAAKRVIVLTHRPEPGRHGEELMDASPAQVIERLAGEGVERIYVDGGEVIDQFLRAGLVDELTISVIPVLLGDGVPLFRAGRAEQVLTLVDSRSFASGLVQLRYALGSSP